MAKLINDTFPVFDDFSQGYRDGCAGKIIFPAHHCTYYLKGYEAGVQDEIDNAAEENEKNALNYDC